MNTAAPDPSADAKPTVITGAGFQSTYGGFAVLYVDGEEYTPEQIKRALSAPAAAVGGEVVEVLDVTCKCHPETCCCPEAKLIVGGIERMRGTRGLCEDMRSLLTRPTHVAPVGGCECGGVETGRIDASGNPETVCCCSAAPVGGFVVDALEMRICEVPHVFLKPNQPYIFTVDADCKMCRYYERQYQPAAQSSQCACQTELAAMVAHKDTDFDYTKACHCAGYVPNEQCQCEFCQRRIKAGAQSSAKDGARVEGDAFRENVARQWLESKASEECKLPPDGWHCTRGAGHVGPCASVPNEDLRSCTICGLTVDVSKGHVAPSSDFTMQGRTKPKSATGAGLVDGAMVERAKSAYNAANKKSWSILMPDAYEHCIRAALEAAIGREVL